MRNWFRDPSFEFRVPGSDLHLLMGLLWLALALFLGCLTGYADDALSKATIVVYNSNFPESRSLAEYYASKCGIPDEQVICGRQLLRDETGRFYRETHRPACRSTSRNKGLHRSSDNRLEIVLHGYRE